MCMKQKSLLPVVLIGLLVGFALGFYASSSGLMPGHPSGTASVKSSDSLMGTPLAKVFVISDTYTESVVGDVVSLQADSVTLKREGREVTLPLSKDLVVENLVDNLRVVVPVTFPKAGDFVNLQTMRNMADNKILSETLIVLKRAAK